jgi:AcrR family transcriptional regulator
MNSQKQQIADKAAEWVWQRGAGHFTTGQLAEALHVSKQTIYKHFPAKAELVQQAVSALLGRQLAQLDLIGSLAENALQEVVWAGDYFSETWQTVCPGFIKDLQRRFPDSHRVYAHVTETIVQRQLSRGMEEGYFRADVPVSLFAGLAYGQYAYAFQAQRYPGNRLPLPAMLSHGYYHFYLGICTPEGHQALTALLADRAGVGDPGFQASYG